MNAYMSFHSLLILFFTFFVLNDTAWAQITTQTQKPAQAQNIKNAAPFPTRYKSAVDDALTLKSVAVAPGYDNVGGVYKNACEEKLSELAAQDHFWALQKFPLNNSALNQPIRIDVYSEKPDFVKNILNSIPADGLLTCTTTKSPLGLRLKIVLYTVDQGLPLIEETVEDSDAFEVIRFKEMIQSAYDRIKQKLPYASIVSSRRGNTVTVSVGKNANLKSGDKLTVAQILKVNRHPKLKFMTGVEKEIIGQITLNKVDDFSSFGEITYEKEAGVVEKYSKLLPTDFIQYAQGDGQNNVVNPVGSSDSEEWVPPPAPQFGKFFLLGGVSNYSLSTVLHNGDSYDSGNSFAPTLVLGGELWITHEFFAQVSTSQLFFKSDNSLPGSAPSSLSFNLSQYDFLFGYKYAFNGNFWGPSVSAALGYISQTTRMTDTSPTAYSSFETSGLELHVSGYFPVTERNDIAVGADAKLLITTQMSEFPEDSGPSKPSLSQFGVFGSYMYSNNINLIGRIRFNTLHSTFDGTGNRANPARSTDERFTAYLFGFEYLF